MPVTPICWQKEGRPAGWEPATRRRAVMTIETLGVDIAKYVFQLHGVNRNGRVMLKRRMISTFWHKTTAAPLL
jgi:hypothetical protein